MGCKYICKFTETAENDLDEILRYITVELCNATAARDFFAKLFDSIGTVCTFPETGVVVENEYLSDKSVRKLFIDNYICYYTTDEEIKVVYILRIVYAGRNQSKIALPTDV